MIRRNEVRNPIRKLALLAIFREMLSSKRAGERADQRLVYTSRPKSRPPQLVCVQMRMRVRSVITLEG